MSHRILELDINSEPDDLELDVGEDGVAIISRRSGRVVGFALHDTAPQRRFTGAQLRALADPHPNTEAALSVDRDRPAPTVSAAICTHDRPELLELCLASLLDQTDPVDEILVIDNAPSDHRAAMVVERFAIQRPDIRRVVEPCPGLDIARNTALRHARGDVVAFVDDDVVTDAHWCEATRACFQRDPDLDVTTGQVLPVELETDAQVAFERRGGFRGGNQSIRWQGLDLDGSPLFPYRPGVFGAGANMAMRRASALALGGFDDALDTGAALPGGGDLDLFHRVIRSGGTLSYQPQIVVAHRHRRTRTELLAQYESWGLSLGAWMTKAYREDPAGRRKIRGAVRHFLRTQLRDALRPADPAFGAAARAELRGARRAIVDPYRRSQRRIRALRRATGRPRIALLPWGDVIDDYLHPIGLTIADLSDKLDGGWMFGYVKALDRADVDVVIICWSHEVVQPTRRIHTMTGAPIWFLPQPRIHRFLRTFVQEPYAHSGREAAGGRRGFVGRRARLVRHLLPYVSTPPQPLRRVLRNEAISTILCQEYEEGRFDICVVLGRVLRIPVHATFQGGSDTRSRIERLVRPRTMDAAGGLIIASDVEIERVHRRHPTVAAKIHPVPNPFDPESLPPADRVDARRALGIDDDTLVAVWHGRVDIGPKGLDVLLDAWATVAAGTSREIRLHLLGTGPGAPWLRDRLDDERLASVSWRDEFVLDRSEIARHLATGDVYVFPSRHEGFPVAPIEALAAGLPIVACDAPGVARIVGLDGHAAGDVVPIDDAGALADAITAMFDDPMRRAEFAGRARRRVDEHFSLDVVGAALRQILLNP